MKKKNWVCLCSVCFFLIAAIPASAFSTKGRIHMGVSMYDLSSQNLEYGYGNNVGSVMMYGWVVNRGSRPINVHYEIFDGDDGSFVGRYPVDSEITIAPNAVYMGTGDQISTALNLVVDKIYTQVLIWKGQTDIPPRVGGEMVFKDKEGNYLNNNVHFYTPRGVADH